MKLYSENKDYKLYQGNMLDMLEAIESNTIDSIVTDPPYELNFMGKGWDNAGVSFNSDTWKNCYEVLKPGGYLLAFGGSRTYHRIAVAIEDAGFEIRDTIMWLYGSGFPKSMSLSKGIEAKEKLGNAGTRNKRKIEQSCDSKEYTLKQTNNGAMGEIIETTRKEYIPSTELAKQWKGWGTCLKPSFEPIIVARKPFKGSLVDNVIEYGVGGINIDECRVETDENIKIHNYTQNSGIYGKYSSNIEEHSTNQGRFPANTILTYDETDFDEVCGGFPNTKGSKPHARGGTNFGIGIESDNRKNDMLSGFNDNGSASRYFYCAKASKKDRDCNGTISNIHPTCKPCNLMQYLVRLVTPNGGTILDPFNGSGSTGKAVMYENKERNKNYKYIGIELTEEYLPIAQARIEYVSNLKEEEKPQTTIFDYIGDSNE